MSQTEKSTRRDPEVKTSLACSSPRRRPVWPEPHGGGAECMDVKLMRRGGVGGALETIVWKLDFKYNGKPKFYTGFFGCFVENKLQEGTSGSARAGSGLLWDSRTDILGPRLWQQWYRWRIQGTHEV